MITEDYVSYEVAKLLKEKGFYTPYCYSYYFPELKSKTPCISNRVIPKDTDKYLAPTLQMAMKWLREVYSLHIWIGHAAGKGLSWYYEIHEMSDGKVKHIGGIQYGSYEVACEAAILYCLENLI